MNSKLRVLTGITTTGTPHLGNYVGAIRPAIAASRNPGAESFFFLADYHALIKCDDPARVQRSTLEIAASWLACGLDLEKVYFYRQSDIPEIPELTWLLTCVTAKGLLNRAHAYKAAVDQNRAAGTDNDDGVTAGLYMYPVLMAADILIFNANKVPVGRDQVQHIEMARDIGQRFNHIYGGEYFTLPEAVIEGNVATLPGLDGRKMSKSYNNTIPLWLPEKELRKAISGIVTNSQAPGEPKNPDESHIFSLYRAFASASETAAMRNAFAQGIGWGDAKQKLYERINIELAPMRERYEELIERPHRIEDALRESGRKVRKIAKERNAHLREIVGIRELKVAPQDRSLEKAQIPEPFRITRFRTGEDFKFKILRPTGKVLMESFAFKDAKKCGDIVSALTFGGSEALQLVIGSSWPRLMLSGEEFGDLPIEERFEELRDALASYLVVWQAPTKKFQGQIRTAFGEDLFMSEEFEQKKELVSKLSSVYLYVADALGTYLQPDESGKVTFVLRDKNGAKVGTSTAFKNSEQAKLVLNSLASLRSNPRVFQRVMPA